MTTLHDLRRARAALVADLKTTKASLREKLVALDLDEPEPDEVTALHSRVTDVEGKVAQLDGRIQMLEAAQDNDADTAADPEEVEERSAKPGRMTSFGSGEAPRRQDKGFSAARFAVGVLLARSMGMQGAAAYIERTYGDKSVAKALNTTGVATGGALIPQAFSNEIIELLRATTVVRACGPKIYDMPTGNLTIPRLAAGATAGYQGELDDMTASQETFDDLQLNAKKLTALVPVSNDLIRRASLNIETIVRDDMVQSLARREDLAFMLGDGSGGTPIGLLNLCPAANKLIVAPFADNTNATIATAVNGVLQGMKLVLTNNFSRMINPWWIMTPTTEAFLMAVRDQVGGYLFKDEMAGGKLWGIPFKTTQQLPTNLSAATLPSGTANDGAYLFLADFADVILAETYNMSVDASDVASYKDSGGNNVSTFTRDQTAFRIIEEHDFNIRHQGSVAVALLPAWAPAGWSNYGPGGAYFVQAPSGDMSAAPSTFGTAAPTGSNNPGNVAAVAPGGTLPGRP